MARIRTIKPEFWTDGKVVQLPFEARLLFIGLFNFVDDHGYGWMDFDRIELQIFPADPMGLKLWEMMDLLESASLIQYWLSDPEGDFFFRITNWEKHQKVDKPGKCRFPRESSRVLSLPSEVRRAVALKYGVHPGESKRVECFYCGDIGAISWTQRRNSSAGFVYTSLTFDHVRPQSENGGHAVENLILCCKSCNSRKGSADFTQFVEASFAYIRESYRVLDTEKEKEKEREREREKELRKEQGAGKLPRKRASDAEPSVQILILAYCEAWKARYKTDSNPAISGRDVNMLKTMTKNHGHDRTRSLIEAYLEMSDPWFLTKAHDIPALVGNVTKIALYLDSGKAITRREVTQIDDTIALTQQLKRINEGNL